MLSNVKEAAVRISELSTRSGVPVATIKYYLREGLVPAGELSSRTQASYDESHLERLALVRALVESAGLSLARTKQVLAAVDTPQPMVDLLAGVTEAGAGDGDERGRARELVDRLGWADVPSSGDAMGRLEDALAALETAGLDLPEDRVERLAALMGEVARIEVDGIPDNDAAAAARYVLVGTALVAPVLQALREVGHVHHSVRRFGAARDGLQ